MDLRPSISVPHPQLKPHPPPRPTQPPGLLPQAVDGVGTKPLNPLYLTSLAFIICADTGSLLKLHHSPYTHIFYSIHNKGRGHAPSLSPGITLNPISGNPSLRTLLPPRCSVPLAPLFNSCMESEEWACNVHTRRQSGEFIQFVHDRNTKYF